MESMSKEKADIITAFKLVRNLKPGDRVQMNYGDREIMTVEYTYEVRVKGSGWAVRWTDETETLYKKSDCVDVVI